MKIRVISDNAVLVENKAYVFSKYHNLLLELDIETGQMISLGMIPEENFIRGSLVGGMVFYGDRLYMIPHNSRKMWSFDLKTREWESLEIECIDRVIDQKFNSAFLYNKYIVMIGYTYPGILIYDIEHKATVYNRVFFEEIYNENEKAGPFVRRNCFEKEGHLYLPFMSKNYVLSFDLNNYAYVWKEIKDTESGFSGIVYDGKQFVLTPRYGNSVLLWNEETNAYNRINTGNEKGYFLGATVFSGNVFIPGYGGTKSLMLDKNNEIRSEEVSYLTYEVSGEDVYAHDISGKFYIYKGNRCIWSKMLDIDVDVSQLNGGDFDGVVKENMGVSLSFYIDAIKMK